MKRSLLLISWKRFGQHPIEEEIRLKKIAEQIADGFRPQPTDPYYWISHHYFDGRIPMDCVRRKMLSYYSTQAAMELENDESDEDSGGSEPEGSGDELDDSD